MPLSPETKAHHTLNPSDIGVDPDKKPAMTVGIVRNTSSTGEQVSIDCPVYTDDTREALQKRLGFCYSILQERLEQENKAMEFLNSRSQVIRTCQEADKRNMDMLTKHLEKCEKEGRKQGWKPETLEKKKEEIKAEADKAMIPNALRASHAKAELDSQEVIDIVMFAKENGYEPWVVEEVTK